MQTLKTLYRKKAVLRKKFLAFIPLVLLCLIGGALCKTSTFFKAFGDAETADTALNESVYDQLSKLDLDALERYVNSLDLPTDEPLTQRLIAYIEGEKISYDSLFKGLIGVFVGDVSDLLPSFATIAAISLLCGVFSAIKSTSVSKNGEHTAFLIAFSAVLVPVLSVLTICFNSARGALNAIDTQIQLIFPVLLTLMSVGGATATAAVYTPSVAFLSTSIIALSKNVLFPIAVTIAAFSVASNLSADLKLNRFCGFFKSVYKWLTGLTAAVFGVFFSVQGISGAIYDGALKRAAKYAIGSGIPVVGGFLAGGFDLALYGSALIKSAIGYLGVVLLAAILLKALVCLIAANVLLRFTAAVTQPLGDTRISDYLTETADTVNLCLASVLLAAFMYFLMLLLCVCFTETVF